ncbi:MAG: AbrB/MazE/SpoVT family DNA-binding domain-containing protein [Clostridiales bacterium]|nr:AbrB/MazE/SpoVT family DNA-binding domain-containing protein [Clostridiales bacterium]
MSSGIKRKLDELGRIVLPIEIRKSLNIKEKDDLEISVEEGKIILVKCEESDIFTGERQDLIEYKGKKISLNSVKELAKLAGLV